MNTALLVIDIQNDYFPGGNMEVEGSLQASLCAKEILSFFRERSLPVVHIQHFSTRPGAAYLVRNTHGADIHENVSPLGNEPVIEKNYPNSFRNTSLLEQLKAKNISHLIITGMMTHMCIDATTRAAFDYGFSCTVINDACAARALSLNGKTVPADNVHNAFLSALGSVYAKIVSSESFISNYPSGL